MFLQSKFLDCKFFTQRHNELRDLEAEFLSMVCSDVEIEPVLQDISGEHLRGPAPKKRPMISG